MEGKETKKAVYKKTRLMVGSLILFQQQTSISQFSIDSGTCQSKRPNATHLEELCKRNDERTMTDYTGSSQTTYCLCIRAENEANGQYAVTRP